MDKETLISLSNYDFATDVYCKLMRTKCDLGADLFDLAEVIAHQIYCFNRSAPEKRAQCMPTFPISLNR